MTNCPRTASRASSRRNEVPPVSTTVFALATPAGRSGVAIIRISGPRSAEVLRQLSHRDLPTPRMAARRKFYDASDAVLDDGLALWFPGPASFTGEDMAELHIHGGPAIVAAMAESLAAQGLQPAAPGAFTRRAFDNGKLDLTEVEG